MFLRTTLLVVLFALPAVAASSDSSAEVAFRTLATADVFESAAVGYSGRLSKPVKAFRELVASPDAAALFRRLAAEGTTVGRLYAVIGLRALEPTAYLSELARLSALKVDVAAQFGCIGRQRPLAELLERRRSGDQDVVGGGFTTEFMPKS
jgi:hypothetical protein